MTTRKELIRARVIECQDSPEWDGFDQAVLACQWLENVAYELAGSNPTRAWLRFHDMARGVRQTLPVGRLRESEQLSRTVWP